ncbi:MAG TPA: biotin--[acetyl-CoA-carboxylase] ligase, partial [Pseudonocardiaceae bacterium]
SGLSFSVLLRPDGVPMARWGRLPLLAGVALAAAVEREAGVPTALKWPNDLLVRGRKCAGILAEVADGAVVLGIGLNVTQRPGELPPDAHATSLAAEGARHTDREALLVAVLRELAGYEARWRAGDDAAAEYRARCDTLGRRVRVTLPAGAVLTGEAAGVDDEGRLLVRAADGVTHRVSAGDVIHLRAAPT